MCAPNIFTWSCMKYCFDLDGTICDTPIRVGDNKPIYAESSPIPFMVEQVNRLFNEGHKIIIMTARGRGSGIDWTQWTTKQLDMWGVKYHELEPMFHKPTADIFIDDKAINVEEWKKTRPEKKGIIAGAFDVIHPGYIQMFKDAKSHCNHLTIALHDDPSTERSHKLKPVQTVSERTEILLSIKYIDDVVSYESEEEYLSYLRSGAYDIRFLGSDYINGKYTGKDINIDIVWLDRETHNYSTTRMKRLIHESILKMEGVNYD